MLGLALLGVPIWSIMKFLLNGKIGKINIFMMLLLLDVVGLSYWGKYKTLRGANRDNPSKK